MIVKLLIGLVVVWLVMSLGIRVLRGLSRGTPEPPPSGELRRVNLRYRCSICGVELRLTAAPDEDPPPPRHCQEEMEEMAPLFD